MSTNGHAYRSLAGRAGLPLVLLLAALAVGQALADLLPFLLRDRLYVGDAAQHTWWLYRFADPNLFVGDAAAAYYSLPAYAPPGYRLLYRLLAHVADPQRASEAVAIGLALVSVGLVAALGHVCGRKTGLAAALGLFLLTHAARLSEGGFPRSFGLVLLLAGFLALCRRRWGLLGLTLLASALLYPPVVLNLAPATAIVLFLGVRRHGRLPRGFVSLAFFTTMAVTFIALVYLRPMPAGVGRWFTYAELRAMPEWQAGGRSAFFQPWQDFYFTAPMSGIGLTMQQAIVLAVSLALTFVLFRQAISLEAWALLGGGFFMWALAHFTLFKLYLPGRYLTYALPVFGFVWAARGARELKLLLLDRRGPAVQYARRFAVPVVAIGGAMVLAVEVRDARALYRQPGNPNTSRRAWSTTTGYEAALDYVRGLPPSTRVAAHPEDANAVPLRCRRAVLVNTETSIAFHTGYYAQMCRRLDATFDMLYAVDWPTIDAIAAREGVSVFLVDQQRLTEPDQRPYWEPFRSSNRARIEAGRGHFAMLSPPPDRVLLRVADWRVLRVGGDGQ